MRAVERTATTKPTAAEPCSTPWYRLTKRSALSFFDVSLWGRKASGDKDAAARVAWCRAPRHEARPPAAAGGGRWARVPDCERLAVRRGRNESALRAARESPAGGGPLATSSQSPRIRPEGPLTGQSRRLRSQRQPVRARAAPRRRLACQRRRRVSSGGDARAAAQRGRGGGGHRRSSSAPAAPSRTLSPTGHTL